MDLEEELQCFKLYLPPTTLIKFSVGSEHRENHTFWSEIRGGGGGGGGQVAQNREKAKASLPTLFFVFVFVFLCSLLFAPFISRFPPGVANGVCETLRDGETSVFHCEPETFIYFEMRVRDFGVILEMRDLCS